MDLTTAARILEAKRPRYFIFENVPGQLGIEKGQTFKVILETLSKLGYCVEHFLRAQTAPASASRNRENECTLQDVLESIVPEKYWLSETATRKIAGKLNS